MTGNLESNLGSYWSALSGPKRTIPSREESLRQGGYILEDEMRHHSQFQPRYGALKPKGTSAFQSFAAKEILEMRFCPHSHQPEYLVQFENVGGTASEPEWIPWYDCGSVIKQAFYDKQRSSHGVTIRPEPSETSDAFLEALSSEKIRELTETLNKKLHEKASQSRLTNEDDMRMLECAFSIRPDVFLHAFEPLLDLGTISIESLYDPEVKKHSIKVLYETVVRFLIERWGQDSFWPAVATFDGRKYRFSQADGTPFVFTIERFEKSSYNHSTCVRCSNPWTIAGKYPFYHSLFFVVLSCVCVKCVRVSVFLFF
jgi:hypothetical protein